MKDLFVVGSSRVQVEQDRHFKDAVDRELETATYGDCFKRWSYAMEWDNQKCLRPSEIAALRIRGDDLADRVVRYLDLKPGRDSFAAIERYLEETPSELRENCINQFWDQVHKSPPATIDANFRREGRFPSPLVHGQAVFARYSGQIFAALMHFSLTAGFSSVRLTRILAETGYLTSGRDSTYRRLLETTQFVIDAMTDMSVGSEGWRSTIRVRLLHAQIRHRLLQNKGIAKVFRQELHGEPIAQSDMLATLLAFAVGPLWAMRRMGISVAKADAEAYVATWRHIGWYLGLEDDVLLRLSDLDSAEKVFACTTFDLFQDLAKTQDHPSASYRILESVADRPPLRDDMDLLSQYSRILIGEELAADLGLPAATKVTSRLKIQFRLASQKYLLFFGQHYLTRWEAKRQTLFRTIIKMLIAWNLDSRRTRFTAKVFDSKEANEDDEELGDVKLGPEQGRKVVKEWRMLMLECGLVSVGTVLACGLGLWRLYKTLYT